ncbi:MAG: NAD-dependent epimerase/dehydratase family protein [Candidatus Hodarchaeales archaeon]
MVNLQVLVTGASGFIGKSLVKFLSKNDFNVHSLDITESADIKCDLTNLKQVERVFDNYSPEVILHLAAISSTGESFQTAVKTQSINYLGTVNLLETAHFHNPSLKYFVLASSAEVYRGSSIHPYSENDLPQPASPYAASKVAAESYILMKGRQNDFATCCIRFCNTFGRIQNKTFLVEYLFNSFLTNTSPILKTPNSIREFMYIPDHLRVYETILKTQPSGIINASSGNSCSVLELAKKIRDITGINIQISERSESKSTSILLNTKKLKKLGYQSKYSLGEGLLSYYDDLRKS